MAHGKGGRTRAKEKRAKEKRARKAAIKAQWVALAGTSENRKKKLNRIRKRGQVKLVKTRKHQTSNCGNPGCGKCYPDLKLTSLLKTGKAYRIPDDKYMSLRNDALTINPLFKGNLKVA